MNLIKTKYDNHYYSNVYNESYFNQQQKWFNEYLTKNKTGFTLRINYLLNLITKFIKKGTILDLGCGIGTFSLFLSQKGFEAIGLDISKEAIIKCEENAKKLKINNIKFILGNSSQNHFKENSFDAIICADIVEHLPEEILEKVL